MAGHLRKCEFATAEEKVLAAWAAPTKKEREEAEKWEKTKHKQAGGKEADVEVDDEGAGGSGGRKKWKLVEAVETSFSQSKLKVYRGNNIPFSEDHKRVITHQALRTTQSANLPERWTSDPEVIKLFLMLRSRAMDAIPSRSQLGGSLLEQAAAEIDAKIAAQVKSQDVLMWYISKHLLAELYKPTVNSMDGWRSNRKDTVGGVTLTHKFKALLVDILCTNQLRKDRESLKKQFEEMIDKAERKLECNVIGFLTDNDGGSKKGRILLTAARLYLLTFPCCAHQGQLILGDYLREFEEAAELMGEPIDFVNWLNNHNKVCTIFDTQQQEMFSKILAYLLLNLTHWTTHLVAAIQFAFLKAPICAAILNHWDAIVKAQTGTGEDTIYHCDLVESNAWWDKLQKIIIPDLEHICYLTNIAQSHHVRPDQFLLAPASLFLHFHGFSTCQKASECGLGQRMCKHIEKFFKELNQLSRFGDKAQIDVFKLSTELVMLIKHINSHPPKVPHTAAQQDEFDSKLKETAQVVNTAFMQYLSETGPFESWFAKDSPQRASYDTLHANDLLPFWVILQANKAVLPLTNFALQLLHLVVNQAGLERWFSDFLNKKNKKRNQLGL
ncbi:hypothetical protein B0H10DRAFT_2226773 [Mycena sp. CBHHK59/15]|nr:hypothetical protein B0H10DRAFT_2226773 [Mycena sp. CBHHK59/15]